MSLTSDDLKLHCRWRNENLNLSAENAFCFHVTTPPAGDNAPEDLIGAFIANAFGPYAELVSNQWFIETFVVEQLDVKLVVWEQGGGLSYVGAATGDALPPQVSGVISWRTPTPGRRGRGRTYLPPTAEGNSNSSGVVSGAYIDAMDNFAEEMFGFNTNPGPDGGVYVFTVVSEADQSYHPVTSWVSRNKWGTQRGRTR